MTIRTQLNAVRNLDVGTAAAWHAAGLSKDQLDARVRAGDLVKIRYGGYATASAVAAAKADPRLAHALQVAVVLGRTPGGVTSHHSAARMFGIDLLTKPPDETVTLTMPSGTRPGISGRANIVRHRAELPVEQVVKLYGLRVTTAARTVIDIARAATFMEGVVAADSALHQRHTSKTELRRVLASCQRWPGIGLARQVVDFSDGLAESALESCARVVLHKQGLPPPELQVRMVGRAGHFIARVDFCWRRYWTIAEADGLLKYNGREDAIAELKRDRLLREAGYEVVHFTWGELFSDPVGVAARIRTAFDRSVRLGH